MQERLTALKTGQSAIHVSESGAQGNVQFSTIGKYYTPASATLPYPGLDGHPRRIIPTPVSVAMSQPPAVIMKSSDQIRQETAELSEKLENEKTQQEELAKKAKKRNVFQVDDFIGFSSVEQQATEEDILESNAQFSGTKMSTIGNIFIPSEEETRICDEVRGVMHQNFP